ncbi:unnamed protein product [Paramecium octaurelia]|uniref:EML-like second beta-propeller domain-containing protein n=1 Tax=Paramecium octaurelia TaxID=43137 RepID=A0A8S1W704_PAROT|nr:unnamed protein product [Paramecium octaurelia]
MSCPSHIQNQISYICIAPHKCSQQRKLCVECLQEHGMNPKDQVRIDQFQKMVLNKFQQFKLDDASEFLKQNKLILSQTEAILRQILDVISESINSPYNQLERKTQFYRNLINNFKNIDECTYADIEQFVSILKGDAIKDLIDEKNSYLIKFEKNKNLLKYEVSSFYERLRKLMREQDQVYVWQEDLYGLLELTENIDQEYLNGIIEIFRKEKITDCLGYLNNPPNNNNQEESKIKLVTNVLKNISEIDFNKKNYSIEEYKEIRKKLIKKIANRNQIFQFFKFLVQLTAIDEKFIQCGSNSLNLLVEMKVDVREQNFENIRISDTSLIAANFVRCNLSGSIFENVDISGINLNGAQLFNCRWKNLKLNEICQLDGHSSGVRSLCFSPDCATLASGSGDNSIRLWNVKTGEQKVKLKGHTNQVYSVCFSPDGTSLASGSHDKTIWLWDVQTGNKITELRGHTNDINTVCFSPDGTTLASGSWDQSIRLWDVKNWQQKLKLDGHRSGVLSVFFSPDGLTLASACWDKSISLWNLQTRQKGLLEGHDNDVNTVCFSPDGTTLASGSSDNSIILWDVKTGQQKAKLDGHRSGVLSVFFSPDGTLLASGSSDNSISLWNVQTGKQTCILEGHSGGVLSVCFSPDGTILASGSSDNSIRLWGVKTGQKIKPFENSRQDIQAKLHSLNQDNHFFENNEIVTINLISQTHPKFQVQATLIVGGEFMTSQSVDLRQLFQQSGCYVFEQNENKTSKIVN